MFIFIRLLRPLIARAPGRVLVAVGALLALAAVGVAGTGLATHDHLEKRIGVTLLIVTGVFALNATRGRRTRTGTR